MSIFEAHRPMYLQMQSPDHYSLSPNRPYWPLKHPKSPTQMQLPNCPFLRFSDSIIYLPCCWQSFRRSESFQEFQMTFASVSFRVHLSHHKSQAHEFYQLGKITRQPVTIYTFLFLQIFQQTLAPHLAVHHRGLVSSPMLLSESD